MTTARYPFYVKTTIILFGLVLATYILSELREILIPLAFGILLAILLNPLSNMLQRWGIKRTWSIVLVLLVGISLIGLAGYFLISQASLFTDELPGLEKKMTVVITQLKEGIQSQFGISVEKMDRTLADLQAKAKPILGHMVGSMLGSMVMFAVIPVYTFLFMFYKPLILNFLYESFEENNSNDVGQVLVQTEGAIQNYMIGLVLEGLAVAALNTIALLVLGVKYALLLGTITALLNVLPYIGGIIAILLPVVFATITKEGYHAQIGVVISFLVIQFIDKHFFIPYIVSSKVKINALFSIVAVLLGGALWGAAGMFLAIPFIGVMKIVFDRIPELENWGKLLGDEGPPSGRTLPHAKTSKKVVK